ncbi:YqaJ viral recombinase family protein [Rhodococcus jostii]|uniref:YqaJ viral recombinase family protein n=1 Tax=Rhodococcus jostii TaxID=132919 RepID=UPI00362A1B0D
MTAYTPVDVTPDTDEWGIERRNSLGASEVAAVIGESSFGDTPLSVYLSKVGRSRPFDPILSLIGHGVEPVITEWVRNYHPGIGTVRPGFMARSNQHPHLHATFDRLVDTPGGITVPLQLKSSTVFKRHNWDNGVPVDYLVQEDVECLVHGAPYAYLAVWHIGSTEFVLHKLFARPERQQQIITRTTAFWHDHVIPRRPPEPTLGDDLDELYPATVGRTVRSDRDTLDAVEFLRERAAQRRAFAADAVADENNAKFEIERFMKDATELIDPFTNKVIHTWRPDKNGSRRHFSPKDSK